MAVRSVFTNSPAQKAGISSGDYISMVNGLKIQSVAGFNAMVEKLQPGAMIKLTKRAQSGQNTEVECMVSTVGEIMQASTVPESGIYDNAVLMGEQVLMSMEQAINNAESELADLKKRYAEEQQRLEQLKAQAASERQKAEEMKAAAEMKRQKEMEAMKQKADAAANQGS